MADVLRFRNARGDLVEVESVPATRLKNEPGAIIEKVLTGGAVAITRHDAPKAVLISYDDFRELAQAREPSLGALAGEFDRLLEAMQSPGSRKAMASAFEASPQALGAAALREAAKSRRTAPAVAARAVKRRKARKAG
ncbi:MAG TPA: type II toxin-antitoxin system prevent-host-death family antitoxin [Usitatibacter sp.]|nr:type II toxin-antitoxin system prevent-host-death family antitoxin [Usitatibacter sp.]